MLHTYTCNFSQVVHKDGHFKWDSVDQSIILSAFFYGYVVTQIPFGILSKKYGAKHFLGYGMLINSVFGFLVPIAAEYSFWALIGVRFIQGLGEVSAEYRMYAELEMLDRYSRS